MMAFFPKKPKAGAQTKSTPIPVVAQPRNNFGNVDDLAADVFARAIRQQTTESHVKARVLLLGFQGDDLADLRNALRQSGVTTTAAIGSVKRLPEFATMQQAFSHILVNLDAYEDIEDGVNALLEFRAAARGFVVILCSAKVSGDDFGTERAAICEATFRLPVSISALQYGLGIGKSQTETIFP
jgi:hypothetical protein